MTAATDPPVGARPAAPADERSGDRAIVGTAGHIDHGKTRLIEALTGIDCDRLAEEKARGITIDLGFAHLEVDGMQLGFVDVPGHERFLHNALAGMGGIRVMLLVVSAEEGVKPQTREHVAICALLGIPAAVVALTKADLVSDDLLGLAQLEVEELLATTPFAGAPILPVSALSGAGIEQLKDTLVERARAVAVADDASRPSRLPIDRAFHLKGLGVVVTGTLAAGAIATGDELELVPGRTAGEAPRVRVRSIQVHGAPRERALAGERTSLQLAGIDLDELGRGQQLAPPGALQASHRLLARCRWLPEAGKALAGWSPVRVHLLSGETLGRARAVAVAPAAASAASASVLPAGAPAPKRAGATPGASVDAATVGGEGEIEGAAGAAAELRPGSEGIIELRLDHPLAAVRGDRLVLRRPSPASTLGGGEVLDPQWHRRRGTQRERALRALGAGRREALLLWIEESGEGGTTAAALARRLGTTAAALEVDLTALAGDNRLLRVAVQSEVRWLSPAVVKRVTERAKRVLKEYFQRERLAEGMPKAEAARRILRGRGGELADRYFEWLSAQKILSLAGDRVAPPGRRAELSADETRLAAQVLATYEGAGLTPPSPGELATRLNAKPQIFEGVAKYLVSQGKLLRVPGSLLLSRAAFDKLVAELRATGWERFSVPQFKDRFGLSRKWAIPLLETLDSVGVTRRVGDDRQLVR